MEEFFCLSVQLHSEVRFQFWFGFLKNGSGGSSSRSGSLLTVPAVPVSSSGLVPGSSRKSYWFEPALHQHVTLIPFSQEFCHFSQTPRLVVFWGPWGCVNF